MAFIDLEKQRKYSREYQQKNKAVIYPYQKEWARKNPKRRAAAVRKYKDTHPYEMSKQRALSRKFEWGLSKEQYFNIVTKPCYYCGSILPKTPGNLDRIDNTKGYLFDNVLPCCLICNKARNVFYTVSEFKVMVNALLEYRKKEIQ